jgi:ribosomal protein L17
MSEEKKVLGSVTQAGLNQARVYATVEDIKAFRVEVDALIEKAKKFNLNNTPENFCSKGMPDTQVYIHLIEAKMWLGKCLEAMGTSFPAELADKAPKIV